MITLGSIVKYTYPLPDEIDTRYKVIEINGNRCLIEYHHFVNKVSSLDQWPVRPVNMAMVNDLAISQD
jgi:hypothetical protein